MILAAGLGTRLRPLSDWCAKPIVPVGDRPAAAHVVAALRRAAVRDIVVNGFHRLVDVRSWADREGVAVSEEPLLLGTAGGLRHAEGLLGAGDVLVWNGDILSGLDATALMDTHDRSGAAGTLALVRRPVGRGNVGLGHDGSIVRLRDERFGEEVAAGDFVGVHVVGARLRASLPERGCLVGDVYLPALRSGALLAHHLVAEPFRDIGKLEEYVAANRGWLSERRVASWSAPDAVVRGAIEGSIIGAGAWIEADAVRCIVWPGTTVRAAVRDAVVTPWGTVRLDGAAP